MKRILKKYLKAKALACPFCGEGFMANYDGKPTVSVFESGITAALETGCVVCQKVWREVWILAAIQSKADDGEDRLELMEDMPTRLSEFIDPDWQKSMKTRIVMPRLRTPG